MNRIVAAVLACAFSLVPSPPHAEPRALELGGAAFDLEVEVPVPPERAFDAFTKETLQWWDHHFSASPKALHFETKPGGGFVEIFDDQGNGAWHGTVIYVERPKRLRFSGPLGLSGSAVELVSTLDFEPTGARTRIKLAVHLAGESQKEWPGVIEKVWRHFLVERFVPYVTAHPTASLPGDDPRIAVVRRYREAKRRQDLAAQRLLLAADARLWFEKKEGPGAKLGEDGESDPWKEWDAFFHSEGTLETAVVEGRSVRTTVSEVNDWYRLVDRPPSRYHVTYDLDAAGKITGVLVHAIPGEEKPSDRLPEFEAWAQQHRPGLLEELMPEGRLDPALEKAKRWKVSLLEWRKAAGLEPPRGL